MTIINDFIPMPGYVGIYLKDDGGFDSRNLPGVAVECHDDDDDESGQYSAMLPAGFKPLGLGIEPDERVFDYLHKDDAKARYGLATWDISNIQTDVSVNDDGETEVVTTFSILVTVGNELRVYDGMGFDSEVLPDTAKFVIAENQRIALAEFGKAIEQ